MGLISGRRPGAGTWRMLAALVRQRRRLALATVAIALGVGYLAGALTLLDRVSSGLDDLAAAGAERADLVVEGEVAYESALEQTRRLVPSMLEEVLRQTPGVAAVVPRIEEFTVLLDSDKEPLVSPGLSEQPLGTNWPDDPDMSPYRFVGEGRPPEGSDEVVIDSGSAEAAGVEVGDQIVAVGKATRREYTIVGVVTTTSGPLPAGSTLALFSTPEARSLFQAEANDNRIAIRLEEGADQEQVEAFIRSMLPSGAELVDGATAAEHRQESLTRSFALIRVLIMGFAGLALVVGMATVSNSLTLLYAERRRTLAAFRLVGAKPHQLVVIALIEAALLAAAASLIGAPLGLVLGRLIEAVLGALGTSVPVGGSSISFGALGTAVLVGTATTVLAAVMPARRACRVAPIEAVVEVPSAPTASAGQRALDAMVVAVGVGVAVGGLLVLFDVDSRIAAIAGVAATVLLVLVTTLPAALSLAVAGGIALVPLRPRALRRIGARDAVRNRARTAATTGALMLATTVVVGLAVFLSSFASSVDGDVKELVTSDLVVDSETFTRGGLPSDLLERIADLGSVDAVSGWLFGRASVGDLPIRLTGIDGEGLDTLLSPGWVEGAPEELAPDGILLEEGAARSLAVGVGDTVPVTFHSSGVEELVVDGVYRRGALLLGDAVIDRTTLLRQVPASFDIAALVSFVDDTPAARAELTELAKSYGVPSVLEPGQFVNRRSDLLHGFERVIQWMLFFTLLQALVGVVNTLLLSVGERRREFGLLRAAGAGRRQIHRLVLAEGLSFAVVGTLLGVGLGVLGGALAIRSLERFGISGIDVPVLPLVVTALAAITLGVAAAVMPARWAAAVPPLEAVSDAGVAGLRPPSRRRRRAPGLRPARPTPAPVPTFPVPATAGAASAPVPAPASSPAPAPLAARSATPAAPAAATPPAPPAPAPGPPPLFPPAPAAQPRPPRPAVTEPAPLFGRDAIHPPVSVPDTRREGADVAPPAPVPTSPAPQPPAHEASRPAAAAAHEGAAGGAGADPAIAKPGGARPGPLFQRPEPVPHPPPRSPVEAGSQEQSPFAPPPAQQEPLPQPPPPPVVPSPEVTAPAARSARPVTEPPAPTEPTQPTQPTRPTSPTPPPEGDGRGWLREPGRADGADAEGAEARGEAAPQGRQVFARVPRSDAPMAKPTAPPTRGWRRGRDEPSLDPAAAIRLGGVLDRLDPATVRDARPALAPLARTVDPDEEIVAMVQGWTKGLLCLVARTDRRLVVVVDRFPEPLIESLDPVRTGITLFGPPGTDRLGVSVVDGRRLLEVTGVRDPAEAALLRQAVDPERASNRRPPSQRRATAAPEYF